MYDEIKAATSRTCITHKRNGKVIKSKVVAVKINQGVFKIKLTMFKINMVAVK